MSTATTDPSPPFKPDDVVDITIRGARVNHHSRTHLSVTLFAAEQGPIIIPIVDDNGVLLPQITVTPTAPPAASVPSAPEFNVVSEEAKAAVLAWLNREARSFTDILAMAWCATVTETGGTPDEVELLDGSRLVNTHGTGWALFNSRGIRRMTPE